MEAVQGAEAHVHEGVAPSHAATLAAAAGATYAPGVADAYRDKRILCTDDAVRIRWYYFPAGSKSIPYARIRGVRRVAMGPATGRARIWGTANPRYWASLDPGRPTKKVGFILDLGRFVSPLVTPDDPEAFEAALRAHTSITPTEGGAPII